MPASESISRAAPKTIPENYALGSNQWYGAEREMFQDWPILESLVTPPFHAFARTSTHTHTHTHRHGSTHSWVRQWGVFIRRTLCEDRVLSRINGEMCRGEHNLNKEHRSSLRLYEAEESRLIFEGVVRIQLRDFVASEWLRAQPRAMHRKV